MFLNYVEPIRSPLSAADGEALGYVGYFAELIDEWAPDGDPNETLFRLGVVDGGCHGRGRADGAAGAVLRVLAAAAAGRLPAGSEGVARGDGVPGRRREPAARSRSRRTSASPTALRELESSHRAMMAVHLEKESAGRCKVLPGR